MTEKFIDICKIYKYLRIILYFICFVIISAKKKIPIHFSIISVLLKKKLFKNKINSVEYRSSTEKTALA